MKATFYFTNLDNFMGTEEEGSVTMEIDADNERHLLLLANHLKKLLQADHYILENK